MGKSQFRKRKCDTFYIQKYEDLHFKMDSIITKYFLQDTYYTPPSLRVEPFGRKYVNYCTNRADYYTDGGLSL